MVPWSFTLLQGFGKQEMALDFIASWKYLADHHWKRRIWLDVPLVKFNRSLLKFGYILQQLCELNNWMQRFWIHVLSHNMSCGFSLGTGSELLRIFRFGWMLWEMNTALSCEGNVIMLYQKTISLRIQHFKLVASYNYHHYLPELACSA